MMERGLDLRRILVQVLGQTVSGMNCQKITCVGALFVTVKNATALAPETTMTVSQNSSGNSPSQNREEAEMPRTETS